MKNGFDLIKGFYSWSFNNQELPIKSRHIALYMFLVNQNNRNCWVEWFKCPYDLGMTGAAITTKRDYYNTLHDLQEWGLIGYIPGRANQKAPMISLVNIASKRDDKPMPRSEEARYQYDTPHDTPHDTQGDTPHDTPHDAQGDTPHDTPHDTQGDTPHDTHIKPINLNTLIPINPNTGANENLHPTGINPDYRISAFVPDELDLPESLEQEENEEKKVAEKKRTKQLEILDECHLPYNSEEFINAWLLFLEYKQQKRSPYTSQLGMQAALKKCSEYPEHVVIESLVQSMSNNWTGFFPEKIKQNGTPKNSQQPNLQETFARIRNKISAGNSLQ